MPISVPNGSTTCRDTALGLINIEQSNVTKIFTVAALFFMPPTMIASIYGMNFESIQELRWQYGYEFALGLMVLVSALTYLFFRWKKMALGVSEI